MLTKGSLNLVNMVPFLHRFDSYDLRWVYADHENTPKTRYSGNYCNSNRGNVYVRHICQPNVWVSTSNSHRPTRYVRVPRGHYLRPPNHHSRNCQYKCFHSAHTGVRDWSTCRNTDRARNTLKNYDTIDYWRQIFPRPHNLPPRPRTKLNYHCYRNGDRSLVIQLMMLYYCKTKQNYRLHPKFPSGFQSSVM